MPDTLLADHLADERGAAVRALLGCPMLDIDAEPETFRLVARHAGWLAEFFESSCGWALVVDPAAGFARLAKRSARPDPSRPLTRTRGSEQPFNRRRYQLLCLVCAQLIRHPVTTVGLLAGAVAHDAGLDTSRRGERAALVDALRALLAWGALRSTAGDVDSFLEHERGNAILTADTARLHHLLVSARAASTLPDDLGCTAATDALLHEPRYGEAGREPTGADDDQRLRWSRHSLARRLLDDPLVYVDDLGPVEHDYLTSPGGRRWLRHRVAEAGFELEERAEGLLAVDPDGTATDRRFPAPLGNAHQLALLLIDHLTPSPSGDPSSAGMLTAAELAEVVAAILAKHPGWARSHRDGDGPERLAAEAVELLVAFGLARVRTDGTVVGLAAIARYRADQPIGPSQEQFEELS